MEQATGRELSFPKVGVVTSLSILPRVIRRCHPRAVRAIIKSVPFLKSFECHIRPSPSPINNRTIDQDVAQVLRALPLSLQQVRLTQVYGDMLRDGGRYQYSQHIGAPFGRIWGNLSQQLESLSLEYNGRIVDFFMEQCTTPWPKLQKLVLRSRESKEGESTNSLNFQLQNTARVALRIPKLKFLMIYDKSGQNVSCFTSHFLGNTIALNLMYSGHFQLSRASIASWHVTATAHRAHSVRRNEQVLPVSAIITYIHAVLAGDSVEA